MINTPNKKSMATKIKALPWLKTNFPKTFTSPKRPLKIGIHKDIFLLNLPDSLSHKVIREALRYYVNSFSYLKSLIQGSPRYDLEGKASGEVTLKEEEVAIKIGVNHYEKYKNHLKETRKLKQKSEQQKPQNRKQNYPKPQNLKKPENPPKNVVANKNTHKKINKKHPVLSPTKTKQVLPTPIPTIPKLKFGKVLSLKKAKAIASH